MKLSRNTVVQALDRLTAEGLISGRAGAGTFVTADIHKRSDASPKRHPSQRARALSPIITDKVTQPLTPGIPALDAFPTQLWGRLASRWSRHLSLSELEYGDPAGMPALRQAIATFIGATRGVACNAEQVIITSGSQGAISTAIFLVSEPGDTIAVENPGYISIENTMTLSGLQTKSVDVDDDGLQVDKIPQDAKITLVAPSHQYPLGITMSMERRSALLQWAEKNDGWIIEDDYDGEYRYDGHPLPALASLDQSGERVLYVGTLSKVLSPSIRLGYLVVPSAMVEIAQRIRSALDRGVSTMIQTIMADFIADGHLALHIKKTQNLYAERRAKLVDSLIRHELEPTGSPAGLHLTVSFDARRNDHELAQQMRLAGLGGSPLSAYLRDGKVGASGMVMGFANAIEPHPEKAAALIASFMK